MQKSSLYHLLHNAKENLEVSLKFIQLSVYTYTLRIVCRKVIILLYFNEKSWVYMKYTFNTLFFLSSLRKKVQQKLGTGLLKLMVIIQ